MARIARKKPERSPEGRSDDSALGRGLAILEVLAAAMRPMTLHEIAEAVHLTDSTVHRILQVLCDTNHAQRDASGRRYHASAKALSPLTMYHPLQILRRDAMEPLRQLRAKTDLTASLVVFVGNERLVLEVSGVSGVLTPYYGTCLTNPLHVAVSGKIMLLHMDREKRHSLLGDGPYEALTSNTITDPAIFENELERIRTRGFSTNLDENFVGLSAIGAALVCQPGQLIGCIMLAGSSREFNEEKIEEWGRALKDQASLISFSTGARAIWNLFG